ncbi:uncharacterized protein VNE69_01138 [Vairimorpha necatrix]|uniref:Telomere replication protein EST3 n=1 Tax=Vairimorpha necatrix TaxID=6039 RepID=A0AAX4J8F1_9MICR
MVFFLKNWFSDSITKLLRNDTMDKSHQNVQIVDIILSKHKSDLILRDKDFFIRAQITNSKINLHKGTCINIKDYYIEYRNKEFILFIEDCVDLGSLSDVPSYIENINTKYKIELSSPLYADFTYDELFVDRQYKFVSLETNKHIENKEDDFESSNIFTDSIILNTSVINNMNEDTTGIRDIMGTKIEDKHIIVDNSVNYDINSSFDSNCTNDDRSNKNDTPGIVYKKSCSKFNPYTRIVNSLKHIPKNNKIIKSTDINKYQIENILKLYYLKFNLISKIFINLYYSELERVINEYKKHYITNLQNEKFNRLEDRRSSKKFRSKSTKRKIRKRISEFYIRKYSHTIQNIKNLFVKNDVYKYTENSKIKYFDIYPDRLIKHAKIEIDEFNFLNAKDEIMFDINYEIN